MADLEAMAANSGSSKSQSEIIQQIRRQAARLEGTLAASFPEYVGVLREQATALIGRLRPTGEIFLQRNSMMEALLSLSDKLSAATKRFSGNRAQTAECVVAAEDIESYREALFITSIWVDDDTRLGGMTLNILTTIVDSICEVAEQQPVLSHRSGSQEPWSNLWGPQHQMPPPGMAYPTPYSSVAGPYSSFSQAQPAPQKKPAPATEKSLDKRFGAISSLKMDDNSTLKWVRQMHAALKWVEEVELKGDLFPPHSVVMAIVARAGCKANLVNMMDNPWQIVQHIFDLQPVIDRRGIALKSIDLIVAPPSKRLVDLATEIRNWLIELDLAQCDQVREWAVTEPEKEDIKEMLLTRLDYRDCRRTSLLALRRLAFLKACAGLDATPNFMEQGDLEGQFLYTQGQTSSYSSNYSDSKNERRAERAPQTYAKRGRGKGGNTDCHKYGCEVLPRPHLFRDCRAEVKRLEEEQKDEEARQRLGVKRPAPLSREAGEENRDLPKAKTTQGQDRESPLKCFTCSEVGHMKRECPKRRR